MTDPITDWYDNLGLGSKGSADDTERLRSTIDTQAMVDGFLAYHEAKGRRQATINNADLYAAFKAHTEGATTFTRRMAINIADFFDTSPRRIVQQLERLWILKEGSWDWFQANGGITKAHVEEARTSQIRSEK